MVNSILYCEINVLCIMILVLLSVKLKNSMFVQIQRFVLFVLIITNIAFYLLDAVWIFVDNQVIGNTICLNWILNCAYYILSGMLGYWWFMYSETVQRSKIVHNRRYRIKSMIPMIILTIMTFLSLKTKWLFYIDANNNYHRGPLYILQISCAYGYIIYAAVKSLYVSIHTDNYEKKIELRTLFIFVIPTIVAGGLQVLFPGYPILCVGNTFSILYVYLTQQEHLISVDPLTKLNNRYQLLQYLSTKCAHPNENRSLYLLLMDVDSFKLINDQYGHIVGDQALNSVAECLKESCSGKNFFVARYGGDEFIVICELDESENVQSVGQGIQKDLDQINAPYKLSVSIGYAKYSRKIKSQQEFIAKADAELYKVKMSKHAATCK